MTKTMPPEATLGSEFMAELNLTANGCAGNVIVRDTLPEGASHVRSEPAATVDGSQLVWKIGDMDGGQSRSIKVWLRADKEGTLVNCATVSADPRTCAAIRVGKPALAIEKTGPATANINSDVTYNVVVRNTGSALARNVVLTDPVPDGMSGQPVTINIGDLAPGQSRPATVTFKATRRGKVCNTATAKSSNAGTVNAEACTVINQPGLKIEKTTDDKELLINRTATYTIKVSNTGDTTLTGVVVTDTAASGTTLSSAQGATASGNTATWNVGELKAGESKTFTAKVTSSQPGRFCDTASVSSAQGLRDSAQACTTWIGVTGVLVEVVDDPDPIQVGETTTFTIRVTNQGTSSDIEELVVKAVFQEQLDPMNASNNGTISGKNVSWPAVPRLAAKASVTFTVKGKGVKAGDHRMETQVTTRLRTNAIVELESTTVY